MSPSHCAVCIEHVHPAVHSVDLFCCSLIHIVVFPVKGSRPGKNVQLTENEIRGLCLKSREIFLSQPILLELEAPLKICGEAQGSLGALVDRPELRVMAHYDTLSRQTLIGMPHGGIRARLWVWKAIGDKTCLEKIPLNKAKCTM